MLTPALAAALALAVSGAAPSADPAAQATDAPAAQPARTVLICGQDAASRRSFEARYGHAPVFVTARDAQRAAADGERWAAPRCMTDREHGRYLRMQAERAALR